MTAKQRYDGNFLPRFQKDFQLCVIGNAATFPSRFSCFLDLQQELYIIYVVMTQQLHSHDGGTRRVLDSAFCAFCRVRFAARGSGGLIMAVQQESGKKKLRCLFPDLGS